MNGDTIYHVCLGGTFNRYFGSITAIYDVFTPQDLGVSKARLWAYGIEEDKPYQNKKCIIYKGIIHRKKTNRTNPTNQ
ncbi:MAG: hypothetical protein NC324_02570 [Bacteroides sp.]|nr:hypothetical protein [Bacteroides sp.]